MYQTKTDDIPKDWFWGLKNHWRADLTASLSVALVALPLSMAIAVASGVQPLSGLLSCVIAGLVTTFFRRGKLTINGPAAGMITAGKFLEHFTGGEYPWVHFDIAGPAYLKVANGYRTKEGTGVGVRLMFDFLKKYNS